MESPVFTDRIALLVANGLGSGRLRPAPGTWGSLAAWLLLVLWQPSHWALALVWLLVLPLFFWAIDRTTTRLSVSDPGWVVADEWHGLALAWLLLPAGASWGSWILLFVLFRFFDALKPGPIGAADRFLPENWGILVDDWLAGILAGLVTILLLG